MVMVVIGVDPHKGSHTAVVIDQQEVVLGQVRVRAGAAQAGRLLAWAGGWPERTWAVEGARGMGSLLAQQLVAAGERVLDVQPKLGARVRLLAAGDTNKNDPNDARSVAVAALRSPGVREVRADDHAAVLTMWSKRHRDLGRLRTQAACRLHAVLCELLPGGVPKKIIAAHAARLLDSITLAGAVDAARRELAMAFIEDLRRIDAQPRETRNGSLTRQDSYCGGTFHLRLKRWSPIAIQAWRIFSSVSFHKEVSVIRLGFCDCAQAPPYCLRRRSHEDQAPIRDREKAIVRRIWPRRSAGNLLHLFVS